MDHTTTVDQRVCNSGADCKGYDPVLRQPAGTPDPLCHDCLIAAERDTRNLVYDYLDLAQLHEAAMSQAISEKTAGSKEKQMPVSGHVEALQAEIVHVLTTWEIEVRAACRLSEAPTHARAGAHVQRAVAVLAPRLRILSLLPPTAACRTGCEDPFEDVAGWEAVHHLQDLHRRCRSVLGRTRRITQLPGACPGADGRPCDGELYRGEPRYPEDPCDVYCGACHNTWHYDDYRQYVGMLIASLPPGESA